jgi:hypothetical protein
MKCSNCPSSALYTVDEPGISAVFYCRQCLPKHLYSRADAGQLDLPKAPTQTKSKEPKKDEPAEPEALDEDNEG